MACNRFYLMIVLRVVLILVTCLTVSFYLLQPGRLFTMLLFIIILVLQVFDLIRYVNLTNREISSFLSWLRGRDPGLVTGRLRSHKSFREIGLAMEQIRVEMEKSRREMHLQSYYINKVLEKVTVGILSFDQEGIIGLFNPHAAKLFGVHKPFTIDGLDDACPGVSSLLRRMSPGRTESIQIRAGEERVPVSMNIDIFREEGESFSVVSVHNLAGVLDEKEMEAWQKLIRVLRHEIMNSVTPITTLTVAMKRKLQSRMSLSDQTDNQDELTNDLMKSIDLIEDRGKRLIQFVDLYRDITNLPVPRFENLQVGKLTGKVTGLLKEHCSKQFIELVQGDVAPGLYIKADALMIEQVLINLVKNSVAALENKENGTIILSAESVQEWTMIRVMDNGKGIPDDILDKIFIPFFTTRIEGSGIGLSLARQIMRLHGGSISVYSLPGKETVFTLRFPVTPGS